MADNTQLSQEMQEQRLQTSKLRVKRRHQAIVDTETLINFYSVFMWTSTINKYLHFTHLAQFSKI